MMIDEEYMWMIIVGFLIAFVLAFGIGANDVANSFGTSVGAKVLTLRQACVLAAVFETLGAVLLGAKVSDTIRKGIIEVGPYENQTEVLMMGNVAALTGSCVWLIAATVLRLPVSATHSIVGATVGFALVANGMRGINWVKLGMIIGSWFISPVLAGCVSIALFYLIRYCILNKEDPLEPGLRFLPIFYALTITVNLFSVFYDAPPIMSLDEIPLWGTFILAFGAGALCAIIVRFFIVPWQRTKITESCRKLALSEMENAASEASEKESDDVFNGDACKRVRTVSTKSNMSTKSDVVNGTVHCDGQRKRHPSRQRKTSESIAIANTEIVANITVPKEEHHHTEKPIEKHKAKISKAEDAPLMENEHRVGSQTPRKNNTPIDLASLNDTGKGANGIVPNDKEKQLTDSTVLTSDTKLEQSRSDIKDRPETIKLFSFLQILTAVFGSFAHGGNDVSNAIGPLVSLWLVASTDTVAAKAATPWWILLYGGFGISVGLFVWGRRVIKTMGEDLTKITPSSGFCIEIGSALTVLIASNIGIPISTTHCKVGSVVCVGRFRAKENVDWSLFRNIVLAWIVTLPVTGGISAAIMAVLMQVVPH